MGESKIPIYAYVDESGNTGKNIFDKNQPDFYTAALVSKGDFDGRYGIKLAKIAASVGANAIHANELGFGRLEEISSEIYAVLEQSGAHFFLSRVEKKYLLATKMFDVLFDSGENAAVAWHNYNFKPLKIILAFKLASIIDEDIARTFWDGLLQPKEQNARKMLPIVCEALKARVHLVPDKRSQEIIVEALDWVIKHPDAIHLLDEQKIAKQGHFPNLVAFANLLNGLDDFSKRWKKKIARITHDEQNEFGKMLQTWHAMFANALPDVIEWWGETYSLQMAPGSEFVIKADHESFGIQMADVALWLYSQALKGKDIPPGCARLLQLIVERGWRSDFSFAGVEQLILEKWGQVLFGPIDPEAEKAAKEMLFEAERRRQESMAQFEVDGRLPFMRQLN